ncbi:MAG: sugar phosphate nucleotidyltransferase [Chthoniobacterales bacterium]
MSCVKTAFVLGAGLGKRLRPLTDSRPKPLIPIFNKPLITFAMDHLIAAGVERFVINTHHLAEQFDAMFACGEYRGCPVKLVFEQVLLETGGGIKNAEAWIGHEPFIVHSGDILTDIDIGALVDAHFRDGNEVTMALRDTGLASGVTLDGDRVTDFRGRYSAPGTKHDFANVSVWNAGIYERIPVVEKIAFVPVLSDWLAGGVRIGGVLLNEREWFNVGSREEYLAVHRFIEERGWRPDYMSDAAWPGAAVGKNSRIGADVMLQNTVIWDDAEIASGSRLSGCIVRDHCVASGMHTDKDF